VQKDKRLDECKAWSSRGVAAKFSQYFSYTQTATPTHNLRNTSHFLTIGTRKVEVTSSNISFTFLCEHVKKKKKKKKQAIDLPHLLLKVQIKM
jgi:hypothetical protein